MQSRGSGILGDGSIYSIDQFITSDSAKKENVSLISNAMDKVKQIKGFTYNLKSNTGNKPSALKEEEASTTNYQDEGISKTGNQVIILNGNRFKPGMYLYSLIVDGREIDTKRIILTK